MNRRAVNSRRIEVDQVFHALGDPTRRAILTRLGRGPQPASALAEPLAITLTAVMQAAAFDQLTAACNACHEAANRGFIVIRRPATSQFPNQSFAPRGK